MPKGGPGWLSKNTYNTMDSFDLTKDRLSYNFTNQTFSSIKKDFKPTKN